MRPAVKADRIAALRPLAEESVGSENAWGKSENTAIEKPPYAMADLAFEFTGWMAGCEADDIDGEIVKIELRRKIVTPEDLFQQQVEAAASRRVGRHRR